jgi:peptide deformylase
VATLEIRVFGDPVLRQRAREVEDFDGRLARLASDMFDTMRAAQGVGLAANQVGSLTRLFTWETQVAGPTEDDPERAVEVVGGAVVNPVLTSGSDELQDGDEGCLSFPGLFYPLDRPLRIEVDYQDLEGTSRQIALEGYHARIWLHEMDHLDGVLFIDHLAKHDRREAMRAMREYRLEHGLDDAPAARPGALLFGRRSL